MEQENLRYELETLKSELNPIMEFFKELKDVSFGKNFQSPFVSAIKQQLKSEIYRELFPSQQKTDQHLKGLDSQIKQVQSMAREDLFQLEERINILNTQIFKNSDLLTQANQDYKNTLQLIQSFKKSLEEKASGKEVGYLKDLMTKVTFKDETTAIQSQIQDSVKLETFTQLEKEVEHLKKECVLKKPFSEELETMKKELWKNIDRTYCKKEIISDVVARFKKLNSETVDKFEEIAAKLKKTKHKLKSQAAQIWKKIQSKPWSKEISDTCAQLESKINSSEKTTSDKLEEFSQTIENSKEKINVFDKVIQRFDEVLLEKAAKDDLRVILTKLQTCSSKSELYSEIDPINYELTGMKESISSLQKEKETIFSSLSQLNKNLESVKFANLELMKIEDFFQEVRDQMSSKADKTQIYDTYGKYASKNEVEDLKKNNDLIKKQLESATVLSYSLCRTLVESGEVSTVRKQREELYKSMIRLANWVADPKKSYEIKTSPLMSPRTRRIKGSLDYESSKNLQVNLSYDLPPLKTYR